MSSLLNSTKEIQEIHEIQLKKQLQYDLKAERFKLQKEFEEHKKDNKSLLTRAFDEIEQLSKRNEKINLEKQRLEEVVIDLNGDIKLLLSAGTNVADVKLLLNDLSKSMYKMEKS